LTTVPPRALRRQMGPSAALYGTRAQARPRRERNARMRTRPLVATFSFLIGLSVGCGDQQTSTGPEPPDFNIYDAVHGGGNEHFYFLPPVVPEPSPIGAFDGALAPVVEICEWNGTTCVLPPVARFTTTTGPGSETVRVIPDDEQYVVNWHTDLFALDTATTYRVAVLVQGQELGHADVDVVASGREMRNVLTTEFIPLVDGRTLPIKFRIEEGALPGAEWIQLQPTGPVPAIRGGHTAVLDQLRNRLIVFGGRAAGSLVSQVWVLSNANGVVGTPAWVQLATAGGPPAPRLGHTVVYDPASNRMIVFAGTTESARLNDVWVLTNANGTEAGTPTWLSLAPSGPVPPPRVGASAVYDRIGNRLIIYGGEGPYGAPAPNVYADVWVLTNANGIDVTTPSWAPLLPAGLAPAGRTSASTAYDVATNRLIMFGGDPGACASSNEAWVLDHANGTGGAPAWSRLLPIGSPPDGRSVANIGYRASSNRLILFAGFGGYPCLPRFHDVWTLREANGTSGSPVWVQLFPTGGPPPARVSYVSDAYDAVANRLIVFGGQTGPNPTGSSEFLNDVWVLIRADGN